MSIIFNGGGGGGGGGKGPFNPPTQGGSSSGKSTFNPGLITSTGGLFGTTGALMTPYISANGNCYIAVHDSTNFDTEEDAEYDYPQDTPPGQFQDLRNATYNLIMLQYRELGVAQFTINIWKYSKETDSYSNTPILIKIQNTYNRSSFPDKKLHTRFIGFGGAISGERIQIKVTRKANSGPISITKLIPCGSADEVPQM